MVHEIAEVALVLFLARGFHETTIDQVAEAAGISRRTFFRYFKTKEEVVFVALDTVGAEFAFELRERPADEAPIKAIEQALLTIITKYEHDDEARARALLSMARTTPALRACYLDRRDRQQHRIAEEMAARMKVSADDVDAQLLSAMSWAAYDMAEVLWLSRQDMRLSDAVKQIFASLKDVMCRFSGESVA